MSREDAPADVFSRLGAGTQDPAPGGLIREYSGRVSNRPFVFPISFDQKTNHHFFYALHDFLQAKPSNPLNCTHVVEGHSNSVLAVRVHDNHLYTAAAGNFHYFCNRNKKKKTF